MYLLSVNEEIVDADFYHHRCDYTLVSDAEVEGEIVEGSPVVLEVGVGLVQLVLEEVRADALLIRSHASGHEGVQAGRVGHTPAGRGEVPEAAVVVRSPVVERGTADVRARLQRVPGPARTGDVVD